MCQWLPHFDPACGFAPSPRAHAAEPLATVLVTPLVLLFGLAYAVAPPRSEGREPPPLSAPSPPWSFRASPLYCSYAPVAPGVNY